MSLYRLSCYLILYLGSDTDSFRLLKTDGTDKHGLKVGPIFSIYTAMPAKMTKKIWLVLPSEIRSTSSS